MHVVTTWRTWARYERAVRRFLMRWMFQGMAKTFTAWKRHVRDAADDRNRGLAKGMAMFVGGTRYKCFAAWAGEAYAQREERDAALRKQLLRKGAMMGARVVRAWFEWNAERRFQKRKVVWKCSLAGAAFRAWWYNLIDTKRRREFLDWALGVDMSVITGKLKAATRSLSEEIGEQMASLGEAVESTRTKLRQEALAEHKATKAALDLKMDIAESTELRDSIGAALEQVEAVRQQLASQAESQRASTLEGERSMVDLSEQLHEGLSHVERRLAQVAGAMDTRAGQDQQALGVVTEQLRDMQQTKANHAELMRLVEKLNHRPKPGQPVGVQQLLAVPYPMPPGATITSPRSNRSRPVSALGDVRLGHGHPAHLREVPTALPTSPADPSDPSQIPRPFLATSEQILVRSHPADAAPPSEPHPPSRPSTTSGGGRPPGRALVPPSSHTSSLSARASATAERILQTKRPASARRGRGPTVALFSNRTDRLERSLHTKRDGGAAGDPVEGKLPDLE